MQVAMGGDGIGMPGKTQVLRTIIATARGLPGVFNVWTWCEWNRDGVWKSLKGVQSREEQTSALSSAHGPPGVNNMWMGAVFNPRFPGDHRLSRLNHSAVGPAQGQDHGQPDVPQEECQGHGITPQR